MAGRFRRGRLERAASAPARGERTVEVAAIRNLVVEQILSGELPEARRYEQAHDEWVVVLEGRARLVIDGADVELDRGDWLLLPSGCPHTLVEAEPGTSWLAVNLLPG